MFDPLDKDVVYRLIGSTEAGGSIEVDSELKEDAEVDGGDMNELLLIALGVFSGPAASFIFASHWFLTRSTDLLPACPFPILDGLLFSSAPLNPSSPAAILATFRLIGVLGGEESARDDKDELAAE